VTFTTEPNTKVILAKYSIFIARQHTDARY